jgi:hypothetical protein
MKKDKVPVTLEPDPEEGDMEEASERESHGRDYSEHR